MDIWDEIRLDEERRVEAERKIIAAEDAAWRALPQAEKDRISAKREAKFGLIGDEDGDDEGDEDGDEDDDDDGED
jgi:hypothetical protein